MRRAKLVCIGSVKTDKYTGRARDTGTLNICFSYEYYLKLSAVLNLRQRSVATDP